MEVTGPEVSLFFRHNIKLKDIKTSLAKNIIYGGAEVFTMSIDSEDVSLRWVPATSTSIPAMLWPSLIAKLEKKSSWGSSERLKEVTDMFSSQRGCCLNQNFTNILSFSVILI